MQHQQLKLTQKVSSNAMNVADLEILLRIVPRGPSLTKITSRIASIVVAMATCQGIALVDIFMLEGEGDQA